MARGFNATIVNTWLDSTFGTTWVKLHTGDPGASAANAAAAGDTTRKQATMGAASGGTKAMTGTAGPWTNAATTETITDISMWTLVSAGTFNMSAALSANQPWVATNTFTLTSLSINVVPLAA